MLDTPEGRRTLSGTVTLRTRRPDLTPTTDLARCHPATATSSVSGRYPEAAVDGSPATSWSPDADRAAFTVDLGHAERVGTVRPTWAKPPTSFTVEVSTDRHTWYTPNGTPARYVRVSVRGGTGAALAELDVRS